MTERHRQDAIDGIKYEMSIERYVNIIKWHCLKWLVIHLLHQFFIIKVGRDLSQYVGSSHSMLVMVV